MDTFHDDVHEHRNYNFKINDSRSKNNCDDIVDLVSETVVKCKPLLGDFALTRNTCVCSKLLFIINRIFVPSPAVQTIATVACNVDL